MAETSDHAAASGDTAANEAVADRVNLPAVVAPELRAAADEAQNSAGHEAEQTKAAAAPQRSKRFIALAASVAFAAGFGSFIGSVSGSGLVRLIYPPVPPPAPTSSTENTIAPMRQVKLELAPLPALKSTLEIAARNTPNPYAKDQRSTPPAAAQAPSP